MGRKKLSLEAARQIVARSHGARERELTARHLLLHPENISKATDAERSALDDYVRRAAWRSLWHHDKRMYRLLREAGEKYPKPHSLAVMYFEASGRHSKRALEQDLERERSEFEPRLHAHLDTRCKVTIKGRQIHITI